MPPDSSSCFDDPWADTPEPLDTWWYWARRADAMVTLAEVLKGSGSGRDGERAAKVLFAEPRPWELGPWWDRVHEHVAPLREMWLDVQPPPNAKAPRRSLGVSYGTRPRIAWTRMWPNILKSAIDDWIRLAGLRYTVAKVPRYRTHLQFRPDVLYSNLFGLIGRLVLQHIVTDPLAERPPEFPTCIACGEEYERWQPFGPARYCRSCNGDGTPQRRAAAAHRAGRSKPRFSGVSAQSSS